MPLGGGSPESITDPGWAPTAVDALVVEWMILGGWRPLVGRCVWVGGVPFGVRVNLGRWGPFWLCVCVCVFPLDVRVCEVHWCVYVCGPSVGDASGSMGGVAWWASASGWVGSVGGWV